jgi:hypothetical protein
VTTPFLDPLVVMPLAQPVSSLTPTPTENPNTGAGEVRAAPFQAPLIDPVRFPVVPSTLYNFNQRQFTVKQTSDPVIRLFLRRPSGAFGRTVRHWGRIYTVVGIAADARINDLKRNAPVFYLPYWDFPPSNPVFLVCASQTPETLGPAMRSQIWSIDPEVAIPALLSLDDRVGESVATEKFQTVILSSFGGAALLLAILDIYGVLAYSVSLRTQEFGIRIALGSNRARLTRLVLLDAFWPMAAGIILGLAGMALVTR